MNTTVCVVVNPAAGRGRAARTAAAVCTAFAREGVSHCLETRAPDDEARIVDQAAARGFRTLAAVGGDGTWSKLAQAIVARGVPLRLALIPAGTGNDLAKGLGLPRGDLGAWVRTALAGRPRRIDVGEVEGRCFLNALGFGLDVAVLESLGRRTSLPGEWGYLMCALRELAVCQAFEVDIAAAGGRVRSHSLMMLVVANGHTFGGRFRVAPAAEMSDGRLDVVAFRRSGLARRARLLHGVLRGRHEGMEGVTMERTRSVRLVFGAPPAYEIDGELMRARCAELEVATRSGALEVLAPAQPAPSEEGHP